MFLFAFSGTRPNFLQDKGTLFGTPNTIQILGVPKNKNNFLEHPYINKTWKGVHKNVTEEGEYFS